VFFCRNSVGPRFSGVRKTPKPAVGNGVKEPMMTKRMLVLTCFTGDRDRAFRTVQARVFPSGFTHSVTGDVYVNQHRDMSQPGKYTIQLQEGKVKSNIVTVTMTQ
jgi:hypothetical protein